jgi:hypothetical protein
LPSSAEISQALAAALEGTGRRFSDDRLRQAQLQHRLMRFQQLLDQQRQDDHVAALLLLAAL